MLLSNLVEGVAEKYACQVDEVAHCHIARNCGLQSGAGTFPIGELGLDGLQVVFAYLFTRQKVYCTLVMQEYQ